jgi:hypothetical protein
MSGSQKNSIKKKKNDALSPFPPGQIFAINYDADCTFTSSTEQVVNDFLKQPLADWVKPIYHSLEEKSTALL